MPNSIMTLDKITESKIEMYFVKIFTEMIIPCNSFWRYFWRHKMLPCSHGNWRWRDEKCILNSDCIIILPIERVKNMVENIYWTFLKTAVQSYLVKIFLIRHNKCSQTDIAHNSVYCPHAEHRTQTN